MGDNIFFSRLPVVNVSEVIKDRLYFVTLNDTEGEMTTTDDIHLFCIDEELVYEQFYSDFGPLNLAMLYRYCMGLNEKLKMYSVSDNKVKLVHCTSTDSQKRVNSAFLIGCYAILYLNKKVDEVYKILLGNKKQPFLKFRDASPAAPFHHISLKQCLHGVQKAHQLGFFDFSDFDVDEYEFYEKVENGDLNWIVPQKFIAFCGPHGNNRVYSRYFIHPPESYFKYFRMNNVRTVIRLNKKLYKATRFTNGGFDHKELFFLDGTTPPDNVLNQFLDIAENTTGAIAMHCKAGLGRTGSLIACYLMKHYRFSVHEAIAWLRVCRPGSVIGSQQEWLEMKQAQMWGDGERQGYNPNNLPKESYGIYSLKWREKVRKTSQKLRKAMDSLSRILRKVDTIKIKDQKADSKALELIDCNKDDFCLKPSKCNSLTQGDLLNNIKALRRHRPRIIEPSGSCAITLKKQRKKQMDCKNTSELKVLASGSSFIKKNSTSSNTKLKGVSQSSVVIRKRKRRQSRMRTVAKTENETCPAS